MSTLCWIVPLGLLGGAIYLFPAAFASCCSVLLGIAAILWLWDRFGTYRYLRRNDGTTWLVWHRRRGWNELMINNVLPVLEDAVPLEDRAPVFTTTNPRRRLEWSQGYVQVRRPYLLHLHRGRFTQIPLNDRLQHLKKRSARNPAVQEEVRQILKQALAELRG